MHSLGPAVTARGLGALDARGRRASGAARAKGLSSSSRSSSNRSRSGGGRRRPAGERGVGTRSCQRPYWHYSQPQPRASGRQQQVEGARQTLGPPMSLWERVQQQLAGPGARGSGEDDLRTELLDTATRQANASLRSESPIRRVGAGIYVQPGPDPGLFAEDRQPLAAGQQFSTVATAMSGSVPYKRSTSWEAETDELELGSYPNTGNSAVGVDYTAMQVQGAPVASWVTALRHVSVACIAAALFGYHMGVVNGPLEYLAKDLGFGGNAMLQGFVVSSFLFAAFFGCAVSSIIADGLGRRRSFQLAASPILLGTVLSATSGSVTPMLVGRCLCGFGLGLVIPVMALYISEISPTAQRGTFGSLAQVATCFGILAALVVSLPLPSTPNWWRTCFWIAALPTAMLIAGMELCAESPRWLAKKGRWGDAERSVGVLWGPSSVKTAMQDLRGDGDNEGDKEVGWLGLLSRRYIKVVILGASIFGLQQLAGINAIFYFSSTIFRQAGIESDMAASTVMGVVNLIAAFGSTLLMDKLGRKKLLMWSFGGMGACMAVQAVFQALPSLQTFAPTVSVVGTLLYVVAFAMGAGPVPALLLPEIFPGRIRAKAMAVSMCVHWVFNFLIGLTFLQLLKSWGAPLLYSCFAAVCFGAVLFAERNIIETKGKSLEEIERLLAPPTY